MTRFVGQCIIIPMRRVLLVIEDYNELLLVEKILKKIGFDVESLPSEASLPERMMGFLPDLVLATGDGNRINGHSVSKKVKRKGINAKLLLLFPRQKLLTIDVATYAAEGALETPVVPRTLIKAICDFTGIPSAGILTKFDKIPLGSSASPDEIQIISQRPQVKNESKYPSGETRTDRYKNIVEKAPKDQNRIFDHKNVESERLYQKSIADSPKEIALDEKRKDFVEKLYKGWKR
jgi:hypothetical protein